MYQQKIWIGKSTKINLMYSVEACILSLIGYKMAYNFFNYLKTKLTHFVSKNKKFHIHIRESKQLQKK